jgi:hypothetical protein
MQSFELIDDDNDDEYLTTLSNNLSGVEKLWRLTDESEPNYFTLRILKGTLEESVSLLHLLSGFIYINHSINDFDLFFCYMVRNKKKRKLSNKKHVIEMLNYNSMYISTNLLIQRARSSSTFKEKIHCIQLTIGQEDKPNAQHWDLKYTDPTYDKDEDLINLLMSCCFKKELLPDLEYLNHIFNLDLSYEKNIQVISV